MVDPAGRFYENTTGGHIYSKSILDIGARIAIQQMSYDFSKFVSRGGIYNWSNPNSNANAWASFRVFSNSPFHIAGLEQKQW